MAIFGKADLSKSKYIVAIVAKINAGDKIKMSDGKSYKFKKTKDIVALEKVQTDFAKYEKILYPNGQFAAIFTDGKVNLSLKPDDILDAYGTIELKYRSFSAIREAEKELAKAGISSNISTRGRDILEVDTNSTAFKKANITSSFATDKRKTATPNKFKAKFI